MRWDLGNLASPSTVFETGKTTKIFRVKKCMIPSSVRKYWIFWKPIIRMRNLRNDTLHARRKSMNYLPKEWFASNRYPCYAQRSLIGSQGGKPLKVVRRRCIAKSCFDVKKERFWEEINPFSSFFYLKMELTMLIYIYIFFKWGLLRNLHWIEYFKFENTPCFERGCPEPMVNY